MRHRSWGVLIQKCIVTTINQIVVGGGATSDCMVTA